MTELSAMRASDAVPEWWAMDGGWQILQTSPGGDPEDSIITETGAPVLVMHVVESAFVTVQAASPAGLSWQCALSPRMARDYDFPEQWIGEPGEITQHAVAWAREAGLRPDPEAIRAVLVADGDPHAESLVLDLVHALGFRFDEGENLLTVGK